jgi:multiple sugar transport system permease protein
MAITIALNRRKERVARRRKSSRVRQRTTAFYLFIAPWLIGFLLLSVTPLAVGFLTSMTNYDGFDPANAKFVGLRNYERAFTDKDTSYSLGRTLLWTAINTPIWLFLSFGMALILNQKAIKGKGFFRTLYYLPSIIPVVAAVWIWRIILDNNFGLLNASISLVRPGTAIPFISTYALYGLTAIAVWTGLGAGMIIFLAGLQNIPEELKEAARIDGASSFQVFRHVILPLMTPIIFFQLVLGMINAFQQLVLPYLLAPGQEVGGWNPPRSSFLYMIHTYRQLFVFQRYGYATALLWLLFIVVLIITLLTFRTARYWVYYEVEVEGGEP